MTSGQPTATEQGAAPDRQQRHSIRLLTAKSRRRCWRRVSWVLACCAIFGSVSYFESMQAFEDFILAHPSLMRPDIWRWPIVFGTAIFATMALFLVFGTSKSKEFLWSSLEGKFFRLCWCVGIAAMAAMAYDEWHHPEQKDVANPLLVFGLFGLWFLLFSIAMILGVKKALQRQKAIKVEESTP